MSNQAFVEKVDEMANSLELTARILRGKARRPSGTCTDKAFEIHSVVISGTAGLPFAAMIRRAILADEETK